MKNNILLNYYNCYTYWNQEYIRGYISKEEYETFLEADKIETIKELNKDCLFNVTDLKINFIKQNNMDFNLTSDNTISLYYGEKYKEIHKLM